MRHYVGMPINTVLVIDDHPVVADSVAALVRSINGDVRIEICHSLRAAQAFLSRGMLPTLIVTDLSLPDSKGIGTVEEIVGQIRAAAGLQAKVNLVVFSGIEHAVLKTQCLALGVSAFVTKSEDIGTLRSCIAASLREAKSSFSCGTAASISISSDPSENATIHTRLLTSLTRKQAAIWQDLAAGYSNAEIALRHGVGVNTVKTHVKDIFDRIGARNRTEAAKLYFENSPVN
jgi:DNA-binding NarL/FixJ family response regulator